MTKVWLNSSAIPDRLLTHEERKLIEAFYVWKTLSFRYGPCSFLRVYAAKRNGILYIHTRSKTKCGKGTGTSFRELLIQGHNPFTTFVDILRKLQS